MSGAAELADLYFQPAGDACGQVIQERVQGAQYGPDDQFPDDAPHIDDEHQPQSPGQQARATAVAVAQLAGQTAQPAPG